MNLLDFFKFGRKQRPLPPIKTVRPPGEARRERRKAGESGQPPGGIERRKEPTMGSIFDDTGELGLTHDLSHEPDQNPYNTQSWYKDPRGGMSRVDDLKAVNRQTGSESADNPYEKGLGRKGR